MLCGGTSRGREEGEQEGQGDREDEEEDNFDLIRLLRQGGLEFRSCRKCGESAKSDEGDREELNPEG